MFASCKQETKSQAVETTQNSKTETFQALPSWAKSANIYEVNLRQYTKQGTFNAFAEHLPRLKEMGIDILWLMPMYPISETKRKGSLGSPYAVTNYTEVNPEFGTMTDFKNLVRKIHDLGMYVILDFVPNHTGWDSQWIVDHPEWFTQDKDGNVIDPIDPGTGKSWGWTDVADLNYDNQEMRRAMIDAMLFWINETDIDGYRMDVAHNVPQDFWDTASKELYGAKEIFMLAEAEVPDHLNSGAFHANYGWALHHELNKLAKGEVTTSQIATHVLNHPWRHEKGFPINFTSNHDENTWAGTVFDRMGKAHKSMAVIAATVQGMPLIYGGQEEPLRKRLEFFEKDNIGFKAYAYADFYKTLLALKHDNKALWNGPYGDQDPTWYTDDPNVLSFLRTKSGHGVFVMVNLTDKKVETKYPIGYKGKDVFSNTDLSFKNGDPVSLGPNEFLVISYKKQS